MPIFEKQFAGLLLFSVKIGAVFLLLVFYIAPIESQAAKHPLTSDFIKFYKSAIFFWQREDIYQSIPVKAFEPLPVGMTLTKDHLHHNLNPPLQTLLMSPLGLISYHDAFVVWWWISLACGLAAVFLIWSANGISTLLSLVSLTTLLLAYFPTFINFTLAQFGLVLLFLLAIAWRALRSGKDALAGVVLGLAFGLKLFVGFFVVMLVAQRRWRALAWFLGTFVAGGIVAGLAMGFDSYARYSSVLGQVNWYAASWNASVLGFFSRIFGGSENVPLVDWPWLSHALHYLFGACLALANYWLARGDGTSPNADRTDLAVALGIVSMLILSPLGWAYYFPALLIPFWLLWIRLGQLQLGRNPRSFLVMAWLLGTIPTALSPSAELNSPAVWFLDAGVYFYGLLLFAILLIYTAVRSDLMRPIVSLRLHGRKPMGGA